MLFRGEYYFLSNMYPCRIEIDMLIFQSVEAAYQAQKVDYDYRQIFCHLTGPQSKTRIKTIDPKYLVMKHWDDEFRTNLMYSLLKRKFVSFNLKKQLRAINEEIIEHNYWHDNFWGNCTCVRCENIEGKNNLGKLLMKIRDSV